MILVCRLETRRTNECGLAIRTQISSLAQWDSRRCTPNRRRMPIDLVSRAELFQLCGSL